jgi:DNA-binding SARP family transcriptional activator
MSVDARASALQIRLFGTVQVAHKSRPSEVRPTHAVQSLLAYLVLNRRKTHAREVLSGLFWGEHTEAQARSCMSTALWRVRQVLEPDGVARGTYLLTLRSGEVGFNKDSDHWLDVAEFEDGLRSLARLQPDHPVAEWATAESALKHYRGDLLEGFYDDWALRERERLRLLYLEGLQRLLTHYSQIGATATALDIGRRILELDPLREEIHREVIRLHLRNGHRALAMQQFQLCRVLLQQELGVEPLEETQALAQEVAEGATVLTARTAGDRALVLPQLRAVAQSLEETRQRLARAIQLAEAEEKSAG